jgi:hypothetical protein
MEYKAISILPVKKASDVGTELANNYQLTINKYASEGWEYVRLETLRAWVPSASGCFGFSNTPGYFTENYVIVFRK